MDATLERLSSRTETTFPCLDDIRGCFSRGVGPLTDVHQYRPQTRMYILCLLYILYTIRRMKRIFHVYCHMAESTEDGEK